MMQLTVMLISNESHDLEIDQLCKFKNMHLSNKQILAFGKFESELEWITKNH